MTERGISVSPRSHEHGMDPPSRRRRVQNSQPYIDNGLWGVNRIGRGRRERRALPYFQNVLTFTKMHPGRGDPDPERVLIILGDQPSAFSVQLFLRSEEAILI
jgi:hypothetical protein